MTYEIKGNVRLCWEGQGKGTIIEM